MYAVHTWLMEMSYCGPFRTFLSDPARCQQGTQYIKRSSDEFTHCQRFRSQWKVLTIQEACTLNYRVFSLVHSGLHQCRQRQVRRSSLKRRRIPMDQRLVLQMNRLWSYSLMICFKQTLSQIHVLLPGPCVRHNVHSNRTAPAITTGDEPVAVNSSVTISPTAQWSTAALWLKCVTIKFPLSKNSFQTRFFESVFPVIISISF